ncbi:hypothetical protein [Streptomyces sp. NPDC021356]|uniref:hypothetical protein n=1 Tax=Streptomyces sp. NPDC021356 TaxID=3154900 RepID=UPI0034014309
MASDTPVEHMMRKQLAAGLGTLVLTAATLLGQAGAAGAQTAADPTSHFDVPYGNTYTKGTLTWHNRSVSISGEHKSVSPTSCRTTWLTTYSGTKPLAADGYRPSVCNASAKFAFSVVADASGGATRVKVCLDHKGIEDLACKYYRHP